MLAIKIPLKKAQEVKKLLQAKNVLHDGYHVKKTKTHIFFPLKKRFTTDFDIVDVELEKADVMPDLKERLNSILAPKEMKKLKTSVDTVGDIAIIELEKDLEGKKKEIASEFLKQNKNIKTVLKKKGGHEGEFRVQKYEWLAGENKTVTTHVENNCRIRLDVNTVYFSMRLATERKRIMKHVKKGEKILVMFSGCAPYPCVLARNTEAEMIVGVEINPEGHKYALENVRLNKIKNVELHCGDVRDIVPGLDERFDRIIMPLPRTAEDFLDVAISVSKPGTIVHLYNFQKVGEFRKAEDKAKEACKRAGKNCRIISTVKCGQNAPRFYRICVDFEVE